ncbi:MAG: carboxypeptidase regulatory-like domain-containing protein [Planctomycetota bacterium]
MTISIKRDSYTGSTTGANYYVFTSTTRNDGTEVVTIPFSITPASDWRVYVKHNGSGAYDPANGNLRVDPVSVSGVGPSSGAYNLGTALTARWSSNAGSTSRVVISAKRDSYRNTTTTGPNYVVLVSSTANDGSEVLQLPTNLTSASDWRFYVREQASGAWAAASGTVTFSAPVDRTAPTGSVRIANGASTTASLSVSLALAASDNVGVTGMRLSNNGSTWTQWTVFSTTYSGWDLSAYGGSSTGGVKRVWAQFRDAAYNTSSSAYDDITYGAADHTPPQGSLQIGGGASSTNSLLVSLTVGSSDTGGSGVREMRFSNDRVHWSVWEPAGSTRPGWDLSSSGGNTSPGLKQVFGQLRDGAGNVSSEFSDSIDYAPTPTHSIRGTVVNPYGQPVRDVAVDLGAGRTTTTDSQGTYSFVGLSNGPYSITPSKSGYTFKPSSTQLTISGVDAQASFAGDAALQGFLDEVDSSGRVTGWVADPDAPTTSLEVRVYRDGVSGQGTRFVTNANQPRPDVTAATGIQGSHGFVLQLPAGTGSHSVYAYALDPVTGKEVLLTHSPMAFTFAPPHQSEIVSATFSRTLNEDRGEAFTDDRTDQGNPLPDNSPLPTRVVDLVAESAERLRRYRSVELTLRTTPDDPGTIHRVRVTRPDGKTVEIASGSSTVIHTGPDDLIPGRNLVMYDARPAGSSSWTSSVTLVVNVYDFPRLYLPFRGLWLQSGSGYHQDRHKAYGNLRVYDEFAVDFGLAGTLDYFAALCSPFDRARVTFSDWFYEWGRTLRLVPLDSTSGAPIRDWAGREYRLGLSHCSCLCGRAGESVALGEIVATCGASTRSGQTWIHGPETTPPFSVLRSHLHLVLYVVENPGPNQTLLSVLPEPYFTEVGGPARAGLADGGSQDSRTPEPETTRYVVVAPDQVVGARVQDTYGWNRRKYYAPATPGPATVSYAYEPPIADLVPGDYVIEALISIFHSTTRTANYTVEDADGTHDLHLDQDAVVNEWVGLPGRYRYEPGRPFRVTLTNATTDTGPTEVCFDAIRFAPAQANGGGADPWEGWQLLGGQATARNLTDEAVSGAVELSCGLGGTDDSAQWERTVSVEAGRRYRVLLSCAADPARTFVLNVQEDRAPWNGLGLHQVVLASPEWQERVFEFTASRTDPAARLTLSFGAETTPLRVANVQLLAIEDDASGQAGISPVPSSSVAQRRLPPTSSSRPPSGVTFAPSGAAGGAGGGGGGGCSTSRGGRGPLPASIALVLFLLGGLRVREHGSPRPVRCR